MLAGVAGGDTGFGCGVMEMGSTSSSSDACRFIDDSKTVGCALYTSLILTLYADVDRVVLANFLIEHQSPSMLTTRYLDLPKCLSRSVYR